MTTASRAEAFLRPMMCTIGCTFLGALLGTLLGTLAIFAAVSLAVGRDALAFLAATGFGTGRSARLRAAGLFAALDSASGLLPAGSVSLGMLGAIALARLGAGRSLFPALLMTIVGHHGAGSKESEGQGEYEQHDPIRRLHVGVLSFDVVGPVRHGRIRGQEKKDDCGGRSGGVEYASRGD